MTNPTTTTTKKTIPAPLRAAIAHERDQIKTITAQMHAQLQVALAPHQHRIDGLIDGFLITKEIDFKDKAVDLSPDSTQLLISETITEQSLSKSE